MLQVVRRLFSLKSRNLVTKCIEPTVSYSLLEAAVFGYNNKSLVSLVVLHVKRRIPGCMAAWPPLDNGTSFIPKTFLAAFVVDHRVAGRTGDEFYLLPPN
jgi:hypothetical protein